MTAAASTHPIADLAAAKVLGTVLRNAGYTEDGIYRLLGDDAYSSDRNDAPVEARRLPQTPLGLLVRAFFLQLPLSRSDALRALGPRGLDAVETTGLAEIGTELVPCARILPIGKVLLASDGFSRDGDDPADYVATYTPTARVLDSLTPRPQVERALDVGTGGGVHALLAAKHAGQVIATDVNERALAYTQLNAALNSLTNVECRRGSLFDPVAGETFDLITCNAPYVVSPERRWAYRDSGFQADELSERVVREAAEHLAENGFATVQISWLAPNEDAADERVLAWATATGCDAWVLPTLATDALEHAAEWNSHLAAEPEALVQALDEWLQYFDRLGLGWVSEGVVVLHRRPSHPPTVRIDPIDEDDLDDAGDQVLRAFEARARLTALPSGEALLEEGITLATALRLERELEPDEDGEPAIIGERVELLEGTKHVVDTTDDALEVIASLDGRVLGELIDDVAARLELSEKETTTLRRDALALTRELLELGALRLD
jgi:methylase of polypeptide subunit release factors